MAFETDGAGDGNGGGAADILGGGAGDGGGAAGASGDAAAASGGDGGGAGDGGDGAFVAPEFFEQLSSQAGEGETSSNRDYAQAKGFKDLDSVFKSLRSAEKAIHDKGLVAVPKDGAKPEDVAAFRTAIGVPDKPDGYEIKAPDGVQLNEPLIGRLRESAVKHGAPKAAFEGLVADFIQAQREEADAETKRQDDLAASWVKEQGGKSAEQLAHVDTAARALGFTRSDMQGLRNGLGADRALTVLAKLGAGMAEDTMITGGKGRFGVTGAEAKTELDKMKSDPETAKKASTAGTPENARWNRLNQIYAEHMAAQDKAA